MQVIPTSLKLMEGRLQREQRQWSLAVLATDEGNVGGMITGALTASYVQAR